MHFQRHDEWRSLQAIILSLFIATGYCLISTRLVAGELVELALTHNQGVYHLNLKMILDAAPEHIRGVVTDYEHVYRLNPSIVESEVMNSPDNSIVQIRTLVNNCIIIFCKEILRVEEVYEFETGDIYAVIIPRLSNVKSGATMWQIQPIGERTRINYYMSLEPGFTVPTFVGPYIVKQKLKKEVLESFNNIERLAKIRSSRSGVSQMQLLTDITRGQGSAE